MTPNLIVIRIEDEGHWRPAIPIPLFLLWIPVILLSPLILLALLIAWPICLGAGFDLWNALGVVWGLLCALPGTHVRVTAEGKHITVRIL